MQKGQIIYFYYDNIISCQKGRIKEVISGGYEVNWLNHDDKSVGTSSLPYDRVFPTEQECLSYSESINNNVKVNLRQQLVTQEDILNFMYGAIYSEEYDWSVEKEVLKEKIKELFGIDV